MAIDLSKLSDADLDAVQSGDMSKVSDEGLDIISAQGTQPEAPKDKEVTGKDDELEKIAGKPDEESEKMMGKEATQKEMHAATTGAVKGATFGMSPNIGAAGDIAADVIQGKQGLSGLGSKWRKYQQDRVAANKQEEEESPAAFSTGEVAGGFAPMLIPGVGEYLGGGKLVSGLGELSPRLAAFLSGSTKEAMAIKAAIKSGEIAPEAAEAALSAAPKAGTLTKIAGAATSEGLKAAQMGGEYGFGDSDKTVESDPIGLAKDTASGASMGLIAGAGIGGVSGTSRSMLEGSKNIGSDSSGWLNKARSALDLGYNKNINITGNGRSVANELANNTLPDDLTNTIMAADNLNGQKVGNAVQKMTDRGDKINISGDLYDSTKDLFGRLMDNPNLQDIVNTDPKTKSVVNFIFKTNGGDYTPIEARELSKTLYNLGAKLDGVPGEMAPAAQRQAYNLGSDINDALRAKSSDYSNALDRFSEFRSMIPENIIEPNTPIDKRKVFLGDLANKQNTLFKSARTFLTKAEAPGAQAASGTLGSLEQNLSTLKMTNPDAYNAMGGDNAFQDIKNKATTASTINQIQGVNPHEGFWKSVIGTVTGSGESPGLNIVNKLGRAAKVTGQSGPVQLGTKLYSSSNEQLTNLAKSMQGSPATKYLGESLEKALNNKSDVLKNAVLFRMLQDPTYRGMLKQLGYEPEGNQ